MELLESWPLDDVALRDRLLAAYGDPGRGYHDEVACRECFDAFGLVTRRQNLHELGRVGVADIVNGEKRAFLGYDKGKVTRAEATGRDTLYLDAFVSGLAVRVKAGRGCLLFGLAVVRPHTLAGE